MSTYKIVWGNVWLNGGQNEEEKHWKKRMLFGPQLRQWHPPRAVAAFLIIHALFHTLSIAILGGLGFRVGTPGEIVPWTMAFESAKATKSESVFVLRWEICTLSLPSQSNKSFFWGQTLGHFQFPHLSFPSALLFAKWKTNWKSEKHFPLITRLHSKGCGPLREDQWQHNAFSGLVTQAVEEALNNNPKKQEDERAFEAAVHLSSAWLPARLSIPNIQTSAAAEVSGSCPRRSICQPLYPPVVMRQIHLLSFAFLFTSFSPFSFKINIFSCSLAALSHDILWLCKIHELISASRP